MTDKNNLYSNLTNFYNLNDKNFKEFLSDLYKQIIANHTDIKYIKEHLSDDIKEKIQYYIDNGDFNINSKVEEKVNETLLRLEPNLVYKKDLKKPRYIHKYFGGNIWLENSYTTDKIEKIVKRSVEIGYNSFLITCYNKFANDTVTQTVNNSIIENTIDICKKYNAKFIALKIHISPNSKVIPSDYNSFMNNYKNIVKNFADICVKKGIDNIFISNEQVNLTSVNRNIWENIINQCHGLGLKCFSSFAGFDDFTKCCFKDSLDGIGINYYPSINKNVNDITENNIVDNIDLINNKPYLFKFKQIKETINKDIPVFISEIGCCNNIESIYFPWAYEFSNDIMSEKSQALYYKAFLEEMGTKDIGIDGIFTWDLFYSEHRTESNMFSPLFNIECENYIKKYLKEE